MTTARATASVLSGPITLRMLRLWHWRKGIAARQRAQICEGRAALFRERGDAGSARWQDRTAKQQHKTANFHIKCVQALNDCFPDHGDTAERDDHA